MTPGWQMSTAHRPTWTSAVGGGGLRDGAKSAPTYQFSSKDQPAHKKLKYRQPTQMDPQLKEHQMFQDEYVLASTAAIMDADIKFDSEDVTEADGNIESEYDDDEDALMAELEKIKREREEAKIKEEAKKHADILGSNPLLPHTNDATSFQVKRRWNEDVVFKDQAKSLQKSSEKRFINDTIRSDFHRKFMDKYIR